MATAVLFAALNPRAQLLLMFVIPVPAALAVSGKLCCTVCGLLPLLAHLVILHAAPFSLLLLLLLLLLSLPRHVTYQGCFLLLAERT